MAAKQSRFFESLNSDQSESSDDEEAQVIQSVDKSGIHETKDIDEESIIEVWSESDAIDQKVAENDTQWEKLTKLHDLTEKGEVKWLSIEEEQGGRSEHSTSSKARKGEEKVLSAAPIEVEGVEQHGKSVQTDGIEEETKERVEVKHQETQTDKENAANPFAQFAFGAAPLDIRQRSGTGVRLRNWIVEKKEVPQNKKSKTEANHKKKTEWIPMAELPPGEREQVLQKWHGLSDPNSSIEDRRFEVMVASRLHARCQEAVVRRSMQSLREAGALTCNTMAQADPEVLASMLTSLQYYNTKSKHLVKASKELLEQFHGVVPESKEDLLKLTGIGPVMADLLSNVNTRASYE